MPRQASFQQLNNPVECHSGSVSYLQSSRKKKKDKDIKVEEVKIPSSELCAGVNRMLVSAISCLVESI